MPTDDAMDLIDPAVFIEGRGTKRGWFSYELSLAIFDGVMDELGRRLARAGHGPEAIAALSVELSKQVVAETFDVPEAGPDTPSTIGGLVEARLPRLDRVHIDHVAGIARDSLLGLLAGCARCPSRCPAEPDARSAMFEHGPLGVGWDRGPMPDQSRGHRAATSRATEGPIVKDRKGPGGDGAWTGGGPAEEFIDLLERGFEGPELLEAMEAMERRVLESLPAEDLRSLCAERGLPTGGRRPELMARLFEDAQL